MLLTMNHHQKRSSTQRMTVKRNPSMWMPFHRSLPHTVTRPPPIVPCTVGLPPELMQIIFWYATAPPQGYETSLRQTAYVPFQDSGWHDIMYQARRSRERRDVWQVKSTLSLVCSSWYALAVEFLLEEIKIGPHLPPPEALARYGHWVRRVEILPNPNPGVRLVDVLRYCPHLQVLSKPYDVNMQVSEHFWSGLDELPTLHSMTRLDWLGDTADIGARTAFAAIVAAAPNIYHLNSTMGLHSDLLSVDHCLQNLRTLRLPAASLEGFTLLQIPSSPWLTHVVLNKAFLIAISQIPSGTCFPQIQCIELQDGSELNAFTLAALLRVFPRCAELAFPPCQLAVMNISGHGYAQIKCIRLYANPFVVLKDFTAWMRMHYGKLLECFPAVEEVALHGDWRFTLHPKVMDALREDLCHRSCALTFRK